MTEALFQQQGAPYADFRAQGTHYEGRIVRLGQIQSRKFVPPAQRAAGKQGDLEFWPDQKPKMTAIITIQTDLRDPSIPGDDGQRSLWIKGKSMTDSVKAAILASGAARRGVEVGGYFSMTYTHSDAEPEFEGGTPTKHYEVRYTPPATTSNGEVNVVAADTPVVQQDPRYVASPAVNQNPQYVPGQPVSQAGADPNMVGGFDVSSLTPQARAALQAMLASQQGGGQQ